MINYIAAVLVVLYQSCAINFPNIDSAEFGRINVRTFITSSKAVGLPLY